MQKTDILQVTAALLTYLPRAKSAPKSKPCGVKTCSNTTTHRGGYCSAQCAKQSKVQARG